MLNRQTVDTIRFKSEDIKKANDQANELLRTAQDRFGNEKITIKGAEGEAEVTERAAWDMVMSNPMFASDYREALQQKRPEVFQAFQAQNKAADDLTAYIKNELGVDMTAMRITDYLTLTEQMFNLLYTEKKQQEDKEQG
jgi:hypothetical protein